MAPFISVKRYNGDACARVLTVTYFFTGIGRKAETVFGGKYFYDIHSFADKKIHQVLITNSRGVIGKNGYRLILDHAHILVYLGGARENGFIVLLRLTEAGNGQKKNRK